MYEKLSIELLRRFSFVALAVAIASAVGWIVVPHIDFRAKTPPVVTWQPFNEQRLENYVNSNRFILVIIYDRRKPAHLQFRHILDQPEIVQILSSPSIVTMEMVFDGPESKFPGVTNYFAYTGANGQSPVVLLHSPDRRIRAIPTIDPGFFNDEVKAMLKSALAGQLKRW